MSARIPAWEIFYKEDTGNQIYSEPTNWSNGVNPKFFDIYNTGATALTIEINDSSVIHTVDSGSSLGAIEIYPYISKIAILSTDTFRLLVRK